MLGLSVSTIPAPETRLLVTKIPNIIGPNKSLHLSLSVMAVHVLLIMHVLILARCLENSNRVTRAS